MNTTTEPANLLDASDDDLKAMGLPPAFTLAELQAHLSKDEIARINEGDDPLVKLPDDEADSGDDLEDDDDDDDEDEGEDAGDDDATEAEAGDAAEAAEAPLAVPEADDTPDPVYKPADTADAKAIIEGVPAERKALRDAYNEGSLTDQEFDTQMEALADKVADAKVAIKEAEKAQADSLVEFQTAWFGKVEAFLDANPAFRDNTPNQKLEGNSYLTALDQVLETVNRDARYADMTMNQRIEASAQIVRAYVKQQTGADIPGLTQPKTPASDKPAPDPLAAAKAKVAQQGKRPDPVQTLGNVTAATENEVDNSRFAAIDRAESALDAEREFGRLSREEQKAYLAGY